MTQKVPAQAVLDKQKEQAKLAKKAAKALKTAVRKKREATAESILFGSELFEPIARKEREIVINFGERFTNNRTRVSLCGKFAFRQTNEFFFELFYLTEPLLEYENDLILAPDEKYWLFDKLTIEELEDLIIKICRAEFSDEKAKLLEELKKQDKERQLELDKADEEFLKEEEKENEREQQDITANLFDFTIETSRFLAETEEKVEISNEKQEEKENSIPAIAKKKARFPVEEKEEKTGLFTPIFRKVN